MFVVLQRSRRSDAQNLAAEAHDAHTAASRAEAERDTLEVERDAIQKELEEQRAIIARLQNLIQMEPNNHE